MQGHICMRLAVMQIWPCMSNPPPNEQNADAIAAAKARKRGFCECRWWVGSSMTIQPHRWNIFTLVGYNSAPCGLGHSLCRGYITSARSPLRRTLRWAHDKRRFAQRRSRRFGPISAAHKARGSEASIPGRKGLYRQALNRISSRMPVPQCERRPCSACRQSGSVVWSLQSGMAGHRGKGGNEAIQIASE